MKKGEKPVELPPGGQVEVSFTTPPRLPEGEVHRGELQLSGTPDPLEFNDKRFFTFKVRPALKVLLDLRPAGRRRVRRRGPRSRPVTLGAPAASRSTGCRPPEFAGAVPRHAPGLRRGLPAQRRGPRRRGFLGPAQRLRPRGGRAGGRPGRPLQRRELQRPDRQPAPARPARAATTSQGGDHLRQDHRRHPSPVPTLCQGARPPARPGPGLPLLGRQAAGRCARPC